MVGIDGHWRFGLAGYKVYRSNLVVGSVAAGVHSFNDPHLLPSTGYAYSVRSYDVAQNHSAASSTVNFTTGTATDAIAPSVPQNFRVAYTGATAVSLDWDATTDSGGSGLSGYQVFRNGTLISGGTPLTSVHYDDTTLSANASYSYVIKAIDNSNNEASTTALRVFRDNFDRAYAGVGNLSNSEWSSGGLFFLNANKACTTEIPDPDWTYAYTDKTYGSFRASVSIVQATSYQGIHFWNQSGSISYKVYVNGGSVTFEWPSGSTTVNPGGTATTLRVEGDSATRHVKVYRNNVLVISQTVTGSGANSGKVGLAARGWGTLFLDDFIVEETAAAGWSSDTTAPTTPASFKVGYTSENTTHLEWAPASDSGGSGLAGYRVFRNDTAFTGPLFVPHAYFDDPTAVTNSAITYNVKSIDNAGNSSSSTPSLIVFRDNFNRDNGTGLNNPEWAESGAFEIFSKTAYRYTSDDSWYYALTAKSFGSFRASVRMDTASYRSGLHFWSSSGTAINYRVYNTFNTLLLDGAFGYQQVSIPTGPFVLTVEADSATRNIKVYHNGVLKINYTDTGTPPNSGKVGLVGRQTVALDDFVVEGR